MKLTRRAAGVVVTAALLVGCAQTSFDVHPDRRNEKDTNCAVIEKWKKGLSPHRQWRRYYCVAPVPKADR